MILPLGSPQAQLNNNRISGLSSIVEISRAKLDSVFASLSVCDQIGRELNLAIRVNQSYKSLLLTSDSIISLQKIQIITLTDASNLYIKDLAKKRMWYDNPYVGFLVGAGVIYLASEVVKNVRQ